MLDLYDELAVEDGRLSRLRVEWDHREIDMSRHAVTTRLERVSELRRLCLSLAKARPVVPEAKS